MPAQDVVHLDELRVRGRGLPSRGGGIADTAAHDLAARLFVQGIPMLQIAEHLGRAPMTIKRWFFKVDMREKVKRLSEDAFAKLDAEIAVKAGNTLTRITEASDEALDKILELMETAGSEQVQLKAAQDILDRNPDTSKTHKVQSTETKVTIDATFLQLAATAEKEITIDR